MKQIQPFQKHWLQITSIVVCRLKWNQNENVIIFIQENAFGDVDHLLQASMCLLIEAGWRIYASVNWIIIGLDNGLSPVRR